MYKRTIAVRPTPSVSPARKSPAVRPGQVSQCSPPFPAPSLPATRQSFDRDHKLERPALAHSHELACIRALLSGLDFPATLISRRDLPPRPQGTIRRL